MTQLKTDINELTCDLTSGYAEIFDMLTRLARGDSSLRFPVPSEAGFFGTLKVLINQLADHIQQLNDDSHDMAIGLCEHYETLNRIARGDFTARASEDSKNELIVKLGELINKESATLTGVISCVKNAEEETKNAYQQLLDIVEFLPDATFVVDNKKRVIAWNRAIEIMTGLEKCEVLGKDDYAYAIPFYGERRPILIDLLDEEQDVINCNYTCIKKEGRTLFTEAFVPSFRNGDSRYFWATASPLLDKQGKMAGAIESIRDITEYKRAEEEKSRLESQLHQAQLMETLMVRLGHDLKTPLTPLLILLPMLKSRSSDPEVEKMADICLENINCIKALTEKTKTFVSLFSSIKPYERQDIHLVSAVEQCLAEKADMIAGKGISCRISVDPLISVRGVPDQLNELFANLISNAVRYSPEHGVIHIAAIHQAESVRVSIQDDGAGIAAEHLEHIFDEFFKADESRHDLFASGLGLSICKRIVINHRGRIWAESPGKDKGATIHFTLGYSC